MPIKQKTGQVYDYVDIQDHLIWLDEVKGELVTTTDIDDLGDYDTSDYEFTLDLQDLTLEQATDLLNMVRLRDGALGAYCLPSLTPKGPIPNPKGEEEEEDPD